MWDRRIVTEMDKEIDIGYKNHSSHNEPLSNVAMAVG